MSAGIEITHSDAEFVQAVDIIRSRFFTLNDFPIRGRAYFTDEFEMQPEALAKLDVPGVRELLHELGARLADLTDWTEPAIEAEARAVAKDQNVKAGIIINGARAALTGQTVGPSAFVSVHCDRARTIAPPASERLRNNMLIVGLGGIQSDAACAVLRDGKLAAAAEERENSPASHAREIPEQALASCLAIAGATSEQVDYVALVQPFAGNPAHAFHLELRSRFPNAQIVVVEHHAAHAASAYYPSPFDDATVLTLDGAGDFRCGARWAASGNNLQVEKELYVPDSLGGLYGRVTELLGFQQGADEHKVQWLSTYGDDRYVPVFDEILSGDWPRPDRNWFHAERESGFSSRFFQRARP